jgi:hypothetical protein
METVLINFRFVFTGCIPPEEEVIPEGSAVSDL